MCVAASNLNDMLTSYQRFSCYSNRSHKVNTLADTKGSTPRKLVVVFTLLGLSRTLHEATEAREVRDDLKSGRWLHICDEAASHFSKAVVSDSHRNKMAGRFFLSGMELQCVREHSSTRTPRKPPWAPGEKPRALISVPRPTNPVGLEKHILSSFFVF